MQNNIFVLASFMFLGCNKDDQDIEKDNGLTKVEGELAGGETTVFIGNRQAFATPAPNLSEEDPELHLDGDVSFEVNFVSNPSPIHGGLGPVFNNNSCVACRPEDGRSAPPGLVFEKSAEAGPFTTSYLSTFTSNG